MRQRFGYKEYCYCFLSFAPGFLFLLSVILGKPCSTPVILAPDEERTEAEGNQLSYGNLLIELPEGVSAEQIDREECGNIFAEEKEGLVLDLAGAQEVYRDRGSEGSIDIDIPPRIRLMHYRAEYEEEMALLNALLSLLPADTEGNRIYADEEKREYVYHMLLEDYCQYFIFVQGKDVYLVQEITVLGSFRRENLYLFGYLLQDGALRWKDSGRRIEYSEELDCYSYRRFEPEEKVAFLCVYTMEPETEDTNIRFFKEGQFEKAYQTIYMKKRCRIQSEDINFDGHSDFICSNGEIFLWDKEASNYQPAELESDIGIYDLLHWRLSETKTIWSRDLETMEPEGIRETETLWQWEENRLVRKRECVREEKEDIIRLRAYEESPENLLFDVTFSCDKWEKEEQNRVRLLYERFYDKMAPKELYAVYHVEEGGQRHVPQGLLEAFSDAVADGTETELLDEMRSDRTLSEEEVYALADKSLDIRLEILSLSWLNGSYTMKKADCDNDGIPDIVARIFAGGQAGNADYVFFKGQPDGSYVKTDTFDSLLMEYTVISWQGKNYLCRENWNYDRKMCDGIVVLAYEDGQRIEEVFLTRTVKDYNVSQVCEAPEDYRLPAALLAKECSGIKARLDEYQIIDGAAEPRMEDKDTEWQYACDLDTDGEIEHYRKIYWIPTHMSNNQLIFACKEEETGIGDFQNKMKKETGTSQMMWVERFDEKNIINVYYMTGLEDFRITGYLIEEEKCRKIYEVACDADYEAEQVRSMVFQSPY